MLASLLLAVALGDVAVLERNSPGLVPSMHSNYINEYAPDLSFTSTIAYFPLLQSPSAITFSPTGDLLIAEACDPQPCRQIRRYGSSGIPVPFGSPIHDAVRAMEVIANGDMIVLLSGVLARLDAEGRWIESTPLPAATLVYGFDVARDQCNVVFAAFDKIGFVNICTHVATGFSPSPATGKSLDVRYLPSGEVLSVDGQIAIDTDGESFVASSDNTISRFDVATRRALGGPAPLRNALYGAISMAVRGEWRAALHPLPRRRSVR